MRHFVYGCFRESSIRYRCLLGENIGIDIIVTRFEKKGERRMSERRIITCTNMSKILVGKSKYENTVGKYQSMKIQIISDVSCPSNETLRNMWLFYHASKMYFACLSNLILNFIAKYILNTILSNNVIYI